MNISRGYQRLIQQASDPVLARWQVNIIIPLPIELTTAYLETTAYFEIGDGAIERSVGLIDVYPKTWLYDHEFDRPQRSRDRPIGRHSFDGSGT